MKVHEAGRETSHLNDIIAGKKIIEGRLARGKFVDFEKGDLIKLREDVYRNGILVNTIPNRLTTRVTKVERFSTFRDMLETVDYKKVLPRAKSLDDAISEYWRYYTPAEEKVFGVLAIHFEIYKTH